MITFLPIILPAALGFLCCIFLLKQSALPYKNFFSLTLAPAIGCGIVSVTLFFSYTFNARQAKVLSFWLATALAFILGLMIIIQKIKFRTHPLASKQPHARPGIFKILTILLLSGLFLFCAYTYLKYFLSKTSLNPIGGWDVIFFWHLKARFFFREPVLWKGMFSPNLIWSNIDYPLLIPGIIAWGWNLLHEEFFTWPIFISAVYMLSLSLIILWYLAAYRSWWSALTAAAFLVTLPNYRFWSAALYCDIPLAFHITSGALLLICALRHGETRLFFLSGFFSGLAVWTKNEGALFSLWLIIVTLISLSFSKQFSGKQKIFFLMAFIIAWLIPASAYFYMKLFLSGAQTHLIQEKEFGEFITALSDWPRLQFILVSFAAHILHMRWHGLWLFFLAASVIYFLFSKRQKNDYQSLSFILVMLIECGYILVFMLAPKTIEYHIKTALSRLLLHSAPLALVFTFETFGLNAAWFPFKKLSNPETENADNLKTSLNSSCEG